MRGIARTAISILLALAEPSTAHSRERNALNYISRLEDAVLHAPSSHIHAHSSFHLTFALHDRRQNIRLSLEPNHDVLSETASVQYLAPDGSIQHEEPIVRSQHRVFRGHASVRRPDHAAEWISAGPARITVYRDGDRPVFEGMFRIDGDNHQIQTASNYRLTQHHDDPVIMDDALAGSEFMVVWRDSDVEPDRDFGYDLHNELKKRGVGDDDDGPCQADYSIFNTDSAHPVYTGENIDGSELGVMPVKSLFARQIDPTTGGNSAGVNLQSTIGSTAGCPSTRKVALIGVATDCTYTAQFGSKEDVRSKIIDFVNSASSLYESTFNISLGIQNISISDANCPGTAPSSAPWNLACGSHNITDRLNLFSQWRGTQSDDNAFWTLLTNCGTDTAVGMAWLGQLCTQGSQSSDGETTAGASVVVFTSTEWQVFAHETGHIFGAVHDCTDSLCSSGADKSSQCCPYSSSECNANGQYIMNPATGNGITHFSPCTIGNICSAMGRNSVKSNCLSNNKDVVTITGQQCGNGIVEAGEDCDCGGTESCGNNPCCNPTTCKFKSNAVCDPTNEDCCTSQCQFAAKGKVCRESTGSCDPAESCSGNTPNCPADENSPDGQSCGDSGAGLTCASGQCTSRDLQCRTIVGGLTNNNNTYACDARTDCRLTCSSSTLGPNACYDMNQYFLDGTPCTGAGKCSNGQCQGSNFANEVLDWINKNKNIFIPVVAIAGVLVLVALARCLLSGVRRRRRVRNNMKMTTMTPPPPMGYASAPINGPPPAYTPGYQRGMEQGHWQGNGPRYG